MDLELDPEPVRSRPGGGGGALSLLKASAVLATICRRLIPCDNRSLTVLWEPPHPSMLLGICGHIHGPEKENTPAPGHHNELGEAGHGSSQVGTAEGTCPLGYCTWDGIHLALWPPRGMGAGGAACGGSQAEE